MDEVDNVSSLTSKAIEQVLADVDTQNTFEVVEQSFNILTDASIKINSEYMIELAKGENSFIPNETKESCKVLNFSSSWTFKEVLKKVSQLDPEVYKNLFVFIINVKDVPKYTVEEDSHVKQVLQFLSRKKMAKNSQVQLSTGDQLQSVFYKFCKTRQIVIQLMSKKDNVTQIFYNQVSSMGQLNEVQMVSDRNEQNTRFASFLNSTISSVESNDDSEEAFNSLLKNPDQLILRFLTIFEASSEFSFQVISHSAANLGKEQFFAAMGIPFGDKEGLITQVEAQMMQTVFKNQKYKSILEASIDNENREIFDCLTNNFSVFIERLPFQHRIEIVNKLVREGKFDMLCDLLESSDFPFPTKDVNHDGYQKFFNTRKRFHKAIENENFDEIDKFIDSYPNLKVAYSTNNKSALHTALTAKRTKVYLHLIESGFIGNDIKNLKSELRSENIQKSSADPEKAVHLLVARSKIFGKDRNQSQRKNIKIWYEEIGKTELGGPLLAAASLCENLQIVFDFGRNDVAGVDLDSTDAEGIIYRKEKVVIIGAKHETKEDEQKIKGVLAHELAHYVIGMLFQNDEQPYFNEADPKCQRFKKIVAKYSYLANKEEDDGCEEIISAVYRLYKERDYDAELIVRIFQIVARYDDDPARVEQLMANFKDLFDFGMTELIPSMKKLNLNGMEFLRVFNRYAGLLPTIRDDNLEFNPSEHMKNLLTKTLSVVVSNVPKLFIAEIFKNLYELHGNLIDTRSIFVTQEKLAVKEFRKDFNAILEKMEEINVFIDISCGNFHELQYLKAIQITSNHNFTFIASNQSQVNELMQILKEKKLSSIDQKVDYEWSTLGTEIQTQLLQYKVNFQNNTKISLCDLFGSDHDLSSAIDSDILNKIVNKSEIPVNLDIGIIKRENDYYKFLFRERSFNVNSQNISQEEVISMNDGRKFVLISDVAGNGKSWAMINLAMEIARLKLESWVTFVELKRFIPYFRKNKGHGTLHDFMVNEVLKKLTQLEIEIFKLKYAKDEVVIFFDGFDEIAPICAEFVVKIMKSFESNGKNQLFISTRDFFKIELGREFKIELAFKLANFSRKNGQELIATIWRLHDLRDVAYIDLHKDIIESYEYEVYMRRAEELIAKLPHFWNGIGLPQIFSLIGKITKDKKRLDGSLSTYQLYSKMWDMSYEEWYKEKGQLRTDLHLSSQKMELNSLKLHELKAMQSFVPGRSKYCDVNSKDVWPDVYLVGCGLMTKIGEEFVFIHETFYEYFVAEFIVRNLKALDRAAEASKFMQEIIVNDELKVIRKFLDEALENEKFEYKFAENPFDRNIFDGDKEKRFEILANALDKCFDAPEYVYNIFTGNLQSYDSFGGFFVRILQKKDNEKFLESFAKEVRNHISRANNRRSSILSTGSKKVPVSRSSQEVIINLIFSSIDIRTLKDIAEKINKKTTPNSLQSVLELVDERGENIFWTLADTKISKDEQFNKFIRFLRMFMSPAEIVEKMKECNKYGETIFHQFCKQNLTSPQTGMDIRKFGIFWRGYESYLAKNSSQEDFKSILTKKDKKSGATFLRLIFDHFFSDIVEIYEAIWEPLVTTFMDDRENMKRVIAEPNLEGTSCINILIQHIIQDMTSKGDNDKRLEVILNILKNTIGAGQMSYFNNELRIYEILSVFLQHSIDSKEEILEVLVNVDFYSNNFVHYIVIYSVKNALIFNINELEKIISRDKMKLLLYTLNKFGQNILQSTAFFNDNLTFHEDLWKVLREYFKPAGFLKFVKHRDIFGCNYLNICTLNNNQETAKAASRQILEKITANGLCDEQSVEELRKAMKYKVSEASVKEESSKILSLNWIDRESFSEASTLMTADEIEGILMYTNSEGENFIHQILKNGYGGYIQRILEKVKTIANVETLEHIFTSTNRIGGNLLQASICARLDDVLHHYLWKLMNEKFNFHQVLAILKHKDMVGNNSLLDAAQRGTFEVANLTWIEMEIMAESQNEIFKSLVSEIVKERNSEMENILHLAAREDNCMLPFFITRITKYFNSTTDYKKFIMEMSNKVYEPTVLHKHTRCNDRNCHGIVWQILLNIFATRSELKDLLMQSNKSNQFNFVHSLIQNTKSSEIVGFTFELLKNKLTEGQFNKILTSKDSNDRNLLHLTLECSKDIKILKCLWQHLITAKKLSNFIVEVDKDGRNIFHYVANFPSGENILNFICDELKVLNMKGKARDAILRQDNFGNNLLMLAVEKNYSKEAHESLWNLIPTFLSKSDILKLMNHVDTLDGENVMQKAVRRNTKEVVEFTWSKIAVFMTKKEKKEYLAKKNGKEQCLVNLILENERESDLEEFLENIKSF